ncbi:MAG: Wyosine base formation domain protein [Frankiales bacterium]|nr:Wyosine base formation domain protein [Frankiales bacterium]
MADLDALLQDLRDEQADLARTVQGADLRTPTPAQGWDVGDAVAHLRGSDVEARKAMVEPERFRAELPEIARDIEGFLQGQLDEGRALGDALVPDAQRRFDALLEAFGTVPAGTKVPWYGPPMSPLSFATARLMEYWAHGQDVADGLGVVRTPTARLRHVCHLGVRTRGFSYVVRGAKPPEGDVRVSLTAPDGSLWEWGEGDDAVTGPALDFCLLVTQRRHRDDLALQASGPLSDSWLGVAQCFAGLPGPGRAALSA